MITSNFFSVFSDNRRFKLVLTNLFLLWWISMPFQSKIFGISLGFFTLYPNLILSFVISFGLIFHRPKPHFLLKFLLVFLLIWLIFGCISGSVKSWNSNSIFDVRNLFLQGIFAFVLVGTFQILKKESFLLVSSKGLKSVLFIFLISGFFEFLTGIHFEGNKTMEMLNLPVGNNFYAPMFIFDNQNTFLTYLIGTHLLLIVLDESWKKNIFLQCTVWMCIFLFANYADSTLAKWIVYLNFSFLAFKYFFINWYTKKLILGGILSVLIIFTYLMNPLYLGPIFKNSAAYRINSLHFLESDSGVYKIIEAREKLSKTEQNSLIAQLDSSHRSNPKNTINVRQQLTNLGLNLIKKNPILGVGPGGYATESQKNKSDFTYGTQNSAHNFPIEIISQYGLIGWLYFVFLGIVCIGIIRSFQSPFNMESIFFIVTISSFFILWLMPSSFLLLEIHRLILPLLCIHFVILKTDSNNG